MDVPDHRVRKDCHQPRSALAARFSRLIYSAFMADYTVRLLRKSFPNGQTLVAWTK